MIVEAKIQRILDRQDPEVQEYLSTFLRDYEDQDEDILRSTLSGFLNNEDSEYILSIFLATLREKSTTETVTSRTTSIEPTKLLSSEPRHQDELASKPVFDETTSETNITSKTTKRTERRQRKRRQRKDKKGGLQGDVDVEKQELIDNHASAWKDCQKTEKLWGGRGECVCRCRKYGTSCLSILG